jgi:hypothetical protein
VIDLHDRGFVRDGDRRSRPRLAVHQRHLPEQFPLAGRCDDDHLALRLFDNANASRDDDVHVLSHAAFLEEDVTVPEGP